MATLQLPILYRGKPDQTGRAYFDDYASYATNDNFNPEILVLENPGASQDHGIEGTFHVPGDYVGTANIRIIWTTQTTSGNCLFAFDYRAVGGNDTESLDQATFQEQVDITDAAPSATDERMDVAGALTDGNFAAGDTVEFFFYRDGTTGGPTDTLADDVQVFELLFEYDDV